MNEELSQEEVMRIIKDDKLFMKIVDKIWHGEYSKIYFVRCGDYIKIGSCSSDLSMRLSDLQIGNPEKIILEAFIPGDRKKEKWIHRQLRKFKVRGEWFKLNEIQFKQVFKDSLHSRKIDKQMLSFFSHG